jgi:hypothetical protein
MARNASDTCFYVRARACACSHPCACGARTHMDARTHARTHGVRWRHLQVALHRAHVTRLEELELRTQPRDLALVSAAHAHFPQPHTRRWPNPRQTSTILTRTYASHHIASLIRDGADMDTSTPSSVRKACHARACECEEAELCARARARLWRAGRAVHATPIGICRLDVMAQNSERSRAQCSGSAPGSQARQGNGCALDTHHLHLALRLDRVDHSMHLCSRRVQAGLAPAVLSMHPRWPDHRWLRGWSVRWLSRVSAPERAVRGRRI